VGTNNQLSGSNYDAAGNMTQNGTYIYDAENRLIATAGISYKYDGDGQRAEKCTEATNAPGTCATNATGTMYWRGLGSDPLAETDLSGNVLENYIFFNGTRIARRDASTKAVHYYFSNQLGTHSLITDQNGTMPPQEESDFYPYGGEIVISGSDINHYKFTGKERDSESGLDEFGARYYTNALGRFMIPDWATNPIDVPYANFGNPQSLNLYSYVENNPTTLGDPDGHQDDTCTCGPSQQTVAAVQDFFTRFVSASKTVIKQDAAAVSRVADELARNTPASENYPQVTANTLAQSNQSSQSAPAQPQSTQSSQSTPAQPEPPSSNDLNRSSSTKQTGAQGQKTNTTVNDAAGSTKYETTPGKTGGQSTMVVRKDANGNTVYVKQEARTNNKDFTKSPDHVHYKYPKDKEVPAK
jgi:RHS repeat-associated protein